MSEDETTVALSLNALANGKPQRFGHMLILKLAHGLISWLARHEVPVASVAFAFDTPAYEQDYAVIFPAGVHFGQPATSISFTKGSLGPVHTRTNTDLRLFLDNAPRDWIFTRSSVHTQSLRVRGFLSQSGWENANLADAADAMHLTPRTLMRRLERDGTSFQEIKDALRRDMAIGGLQAGHKSIEAIAHELGFSSAASFHKAFQRWTGSTPTTYRRKSLIQQ